TITIRNGLYGPYVNWNKINATLPKDKDPATVTLAEALELILAKASIKKTKQKATSKKKATPKKSSPRKKKA
ncbi:MAG: topoisomerase C-terminal repeat-containing protein, partial [Bartonella sp.]|nr:topoisomerase C-terminal repeat-containing protein [Bartonella sp.]